MSASEIVEQVKICEEAGMEPLFHHLVGEGSGSVMKVQCIPKK